MSYTTQQTADKILAMLGQEKPISFEKARALINEKFAGVNCRVVANPMMPGAIKFYVMSPMGRKCITKTYHIPCPF